MPIRNILENFKHFVKYEPSKRVNIDEPRWNQDTFIGRFKHFWEITNPRNLFYSDRQLEHAKDIVTRYRQGENFPSMSEDRLWRYKRIYDASFHPETGEKTFIVGRMAFQVPGNMIITAGMLTFYKSMFSVLLWQWINQSFNATVNYCNRSGAKQIADSEIFKNYVQAVGLSMGISYYFTRLAAKSRPVVARLVPFLAVASANAVNIPLVRQKEIKDGIKITTKDGIPLGYSKTIAVIAIAQVVSSRVLMAVPSMAVLPFVMTGLEKSGFLKKFPWFPFPFQTLACGAILLVSTPAGCALFPQTASLPISFVENPLYERLTMLPFYPERVYYNKGL